MQIFVNDQKLEAEFDGEENVGQVYDAISHWTSNNRKYILSLKVDETDVSVSHLKDISIDTVGRLDFAIGDESDLVLSTIEELDGYVDQIGSTLYEQQQLSTEDAENLNEGLHWVRQILQSLSGILKIDLNQSVVEMHDGNANLEAVMTRLEATVKEAQAKRESVNVAEFLAVLRGLKSFTMRILQQFRAMAASYEELHELIGKFETGIPAIIEKLVKINEGFSTGKDMVALETLERICDELELFMSALSALDHKLKADGKDQIGTIEIEGRSMQEQSGEIMALLKDLSSALEENDVVAVGDILEYELTEKLSEFRPYLSKIGQLMLAAKH